MTLAPRSKFLLTIERDVCSVIVGLAGLSGLVWEPYIPLLVMVAAVLWLRRIAVALRVHPEPLAPREKRSVFIFECLIIVLFLAGIFAYALGAHSEIVWIVFCSFLVIAPASLYFGYRDLYISQT